MAQPCYQTQHHLKGDLLETLLSSVQYGFFNKSAVKGYSCHY